MNEKKTNAIDEDESLGDETKEFTGTEIPTGPPDLPESADHITEKKRPWVLYITVPLLVAALVVLVYLLFFKEKPLDQGTAQIRQMQQLTQKIQGLESDMKKKQDEVFSLMNEYKEKSGKPFIGVNPLNLNEEEQKLLEQKIKEEKDVSLKSLLEEISEKNKDIRDLKGKKRTIETMIAMIMKEKVEKVRIFKSLFLVKGRPFKE